MISPDRFFDEVFYDLCEQITECNAMADDELPEDLTIEVLAQPMVGFSGPNLDRMSQLAGTLYEISVRIDDDLDEFNTAMTRALGYWEGDAARAVSNFQGRIGGYVNTMGDRLRAAADGIVKYGSVIHAARGQIKTLTVTLIDALHKKAHSDETVDRNAAIGVLVLAAGVALMPLTAGTSEAIAATVLTTMISGWNQAMQAENNKQITGTTYQDLCDTFFTAVWDVFTEADAAIREKVVPVLDRELAALCAEPLPKLAADLEDRRTFHPRTTSRGRGGDGLVGEDATTPSNTVASTVARALDG